MGSVEAATTVVVVVVVEVEVVVVVEVEVEVEVEVNAQDNNLNDLYSFLRTFRKIKLEEKYRKILQTSHNRCDRYDARGAAEAN